MTVNELEQMIKTMTHAEIIELRDKLKADKSSLANFRPLYYDYTAQVWID